MATAVRVRVHVHRIVTHFGYRRRAVQHHVFAVAGRRVERARHALDVGHRMSDHVLRHFQTEAVPRFKQTAIALLLRFHQALAYRAVGGLAEIAAFRVLQMRTARQQRDSHIGDRRAGEHAQMLAFLEMLHDEALPVAVEHVLAAHGGVCHSRALRQRFEQHMRFGVVTQRLEMADAFDRRGDRLLVQDAARSERDVQAETVLSLMQLSMTKLRLNLKHINVSSFLKKLTLLNWKKLFLMKLVQL